MSDTAASKDSKFSFRIGHNIMLEDRVLPATWPIPSGALIETYGQYQEIVYSEDDKIIPNNSVSYDKSIHMHEGIDIAAKPVRAHSPWDRLCELQLKAK